MRCLWACCSRGVRVLSNASDGRISLLSSQVPRPNRGVLGLSKLEQARVRHGLSIVFALMRDHGQRSKRADNVCIIPKITLRSAYSLSDGVEDSLQARKIESYMHRLNSYCKMTHHQALHHSNISSCKHPDLIMPWAYSTPHSFPGSPVTTSPAPRPPTS